MKRALFVVLCLAACAPRPAGTAGGTTSGTAHVPPPDPGEERTYTRISVEPDGRIQVGFEGVVVSRAEKIPAPAKGGTQWLTVQCAPTEKAIRAMVDVAEVADARGWFVVTRVMPSSGTSREGLDVNEKRQKPPAMLVAEVLPDGNITLGGWTAASEKVKTLLDGGKCKAEQAVALKGGGTPHHHVFRAAGFLAAAGCEVVVVQRPAVR